MSILTPSILSACLPSLVDPDAWADALSLATDQFDITSPARVAAFLAQIAEESNALRQLVEDLDYSTIRLMEVWPNRFATAAAAAPYAHLPQKLANHVYAARLGNGDEASGDGWRYRGRGLLQITGRANYQIVSGALNHGFVDNPDDLGTVSWAALAAAHYWRSHGLNVLADLGTDASFIAITRAINGGEAGLDSRRLYWTRARAALGIAVPGAGSLTGPPLGGGSAAGNA
jgi:putative chitinase